MIIKCPECGHQVSDKAPVCPSCGVEIAGHIVRCPHCGEIHLISDGICPNCHHSLTHSSKQEADADDTVLSSVASIDEDELSSDADTPAIADSESTEREALNGNDDSATDIQEEQETAEPVKTVPIIDDDEQAKPKKKKSNHAALIVSFIIATAICLVLFYAYNNGNISKEAAEYKNAIESRDAAVMQSYLNTYTDAPAAHRDSVEALLHAIQSLDPQWDNVKKTTDPNELRQYLQQNPKSSHRNEAITMIDELDWQTALQNHDFANYLSLHQNGRHASEAVDSVRLTMDMPASGDDKQKAVSAVRSFLVAINAHNGERVRNSLATHLDYFNEKTSVGSDEGLNYMAIIYRDADRLNWHVDNASAAKVSKKGDGQSAEYSVALPARLSVNYTNGKNVQSRYNIQAKVNGAGLITAIKLIRLAED